jgi:hypothetical protein
LIERLFFKAKSIASCKVTFSTVEAVSSPLPDTADDCAKVRVLARRKVESKILANFIRMLDAEVKAFQTIDYNNGFDNTILRKIIIHRDKKWINGFIEV